MRRTTANCHRVADQQRVLLAELARLDVDDVIRCLGPFVTPERFARFDTVIGRRLDSVTVVLDAPHDPHNGAAIVRSADAFGLQRIHVIEKIESFLAANSVARGSERWVDVVTHRNDADALAALEAGSFVCVATHPEGRLAPEDLAQIEGRVAIVLGNERRGIADELMAACETSVRIPMRGFCESLNVSVTAAILLESLTRKRPGDLPENERRSLLARALILTLPHAADILEAQGMRIARDALAEPASP